MALYCRALSRRQAVLRAQKEVKSLRLREERVDPGRRVDVVAGD